VRIRPDEGNEWRYDAIQKAADYYDRNCSDAVAFACDNLPELADSAREVLEQNDLTEQQKRRTASRGRTHDAKVIFEPPLSLWRLRAVLRVENDISKLL